MDLFLLDASAGAVADTVVTLEARDRLALAADLAVLVAAVAMAIVAVVLVRVGLEWRRMLVEVRETARHHLVPVAERTRAISENLQAITQSLRSDVERMDDAVKTLAEGLHQASARLRERIEDFNALLEVVQSEAEEAFLDTAAAARGVRESARAMARPPQRTGSDLPEYEPAWPPERVLGERDAPADDSLRAR